jgi:Flp pilus assembly protein TadG
MSRQLRKSLRSSLSRYAWAADGNVTIIFSLSVLVLLGIGGAAVDYARLIDQRTVFAAAADAAVLAAISTAREAEKNGTPAIPTLAKSAAEKAWDKNIETALIPDKKGPNIVISKTGSAWTAKVTYAEAMPTTFASLLGIRNMKLDGTASASTTIDKITTNWDFHIVVDDSSSMGIGATQADMDALVADPNINCAFACHWANYAAGEQDSASRAKAKNIKLRIDVVDDAVDAMITEMKASSKGNNVRAKLWGLNDNAVSLVDLTTKLNDVKDYNIQLYKTPVSVGNTNYETSIDQVATEVGKAGDGKSAVNPKKAVFIVTDGIQDTGFYTSTTSYTWYADHHMGTVDPAACAVMKNNGVLVGVLYIDYITPQGYEGAVNPIMGDVLPNMKACASDGLFFNATSPAGIALAMKDMLAAAMGLGAVRLTE